jgi:hypothetical protein
VQEFTEIIFRRESKKDKSKKYEVPSKPEKKRGEERGCGKSKYFRKMIFNDQQIPPHDFEQMGKKTK